MCFEYIIWQFKIISISKDSVCNVNMTLYVCPVQQNVELSSSNVKNLFLKMLFVGKYRKWCEIVFHNRNLNVLKSILLLLQYLHNMS